VQTWGSLQTWSQTCGSGAGSRSESVPSRVRWLHSQMRFISSCSREAKSSPPWLMARSQPQRAEIILAALEQHRLEFGRQELLHERDVLVEKLLLQIDRVGRDEGLAVLRQRVKNRRHEVGEAFAHAGARLDDEMRAVLAGAATAEAIVCCWGRYSKSFDLASRPPGPKARFTCRSNSEGKSSRGAIMNRARVRLPVGVIFLKLLCPFTDKFLH
jgi:hypothetical protein